MSDTDSSPQNSDANPAVALLESNYNYLSDLYKRGRFEDDIDRARFDFFSEPARRNGGEGGGDSDGLPAPMKLAADDLYELAVHVESQEARAALGSEILVLRAKILSYEIDDYFLDVPEEKAKFFVGEAREVARALQGFDGSGESAAADPLVAHAARLYPSVAGGKRQRELVQQLVLAALSGVNQMYRRNLDEYYHEALRLAEKLRLYILHGLPKLASPTRLSLGLLGLDLYMLGRLKLSLNIPGADGDFIESAECYANRVHEKEAQYRRGEITLEEYQSTRLLTLRRSALVSAFGSGFLSLLTSDLPSALKSIALARGIAKQNSGLVNSAYTDLLYCAVKRAQHSSDPRVLREVRSTLRRCLSVFRRYVPGRHYEHRAGLELALAYPFIARAQPRWARPSYALAERYLARAVEFAERGAARGVDDDGDDAAPPRAGEPERPRNARLLAEALTYMSHIVRHCSPRDAREVERAIELARRAVTSANDSQLYASEARIAMGAALAAKAELLGKDDVEAYRRALSDARVNFQHALIFNGGANARVSAVCFIRLGQLCLMDEETFGEARHWNDRWLGIKPQVHHEFCHHLGAELERSVERLGGVTYLLVDPSRSLDRDYWREELDKFLRNQAVYHVAKEMGESARGAEDEASKSAKKGTSVIRKRLADFLHNETGVSVSFAYEWIKDYHLERRLKEHLRL